jgi:hypothetical protein
VIADGEQAARIRPDPLPAPAPAQTSPSIEDEKPETSGHSAPDFGVSAEGESPDNVVRFPAPAMTSARGRPKKDGNDALRVDYVKASRNTWAFRIRWKEADGREPAVYVSRVNDKLFNSITKGKVRYAAFKKQLVFSYLSRAVRQSDGADASANRSV